MIFDSLSLYLLLFIVFNLIAIFVLFRNAQRKLTENTGLVIENQQLKDRVDNQEANLSSFRINLQTVEAQVAELTEEKMELVNTKGQFLQLQQNHIKTETQLNDKQTEVTQLQDQLVKLEKEVSGLNEQLIAQTKDAEEKIQLLEKTKKQLGDEFKVLANQIFEQKQSQFKQASQETLEATLKPMQGVLDDFKKRVETVHKEDVEGRASLSEQLRQLQKLNSQMSTETQNLTSALKGDNKTQGNWGELVLERMLERSGLTLGIEFEREKSFTDEEGKRLRPDVIINLPDSKHVIIDSKVSLVHYEQALNAETEQDKRAATKAHLASLQAHIKGLADKHYEHIAQLNAPDFVLMFLPVEGAYLMAIEANSLVFEDAFENKVAVVTPTTLFTTLKTIEQLWRYERQSENTLKLISRAADVHDKFVGFVETFEKVGAQFETASNSYQKARNQLVQGNGNLIRQAEMLKELAGKTKKEIPSHLLDQAEGQKLEDKK